MRTASFEQVAKFSSMLFNITEETINDTYNYFVNTPEFQNEYNIKQLREMIEHIFNVNLYRKNGLLKIILMFMEKYTEIAKVIKSLSIKPPFKCILRESNKDYEDPIIFNSNGFTLNKLHKDDIIEFVDEDDEIIMILTVLNNFKIFNRLSVTKNWFFIYYK